MTNINRRIDLRQRRGAGGDRALWHQQSTYAMRFFAIPLYDMILRYYLMMVVVLLAGFSGYYLLGILALPIFLSAILGVSFKPAPVKEEEMAAAPSSARVIELQAPAAAAEKVA